MTTGIWEERFGGREADSDGSHRHRQIATVALFFGAAFAIY
jgi:hypothetical protein